MCLGEAWGAEARPPPFISMSIFLSAIFLVLAWRESLIYKNEMRGGFTPTDAGQGL
ncbi:hypothetical protein BRCON_1408 [Candidatus Sumerlaea chitinivorans]|uniref:Uncharacterized protein n=1 Tax=Sumerlaea chitinivorans TaxID=2250252 RepID=A0A2Z4Y712_SUMC1|nr:hypothetical protein BRCON_1408 [Candidatus Sumerlaea chitinivorans]